MSQHPQTPKSPLRFNAPARHTYEYSTLDQMLTKMQQEGLGQILLTRNADALLYPSSQSIAVQERIRNTLDDMLNSARLRDLLDQNVHPKLFPKWMYVTQSLPTPLSILSSPH
jgi:hypothetical protein